MDMDKKNLLRVQIETRDIQSILAQRKKVAIVRDILYPSNYSIVCAAFEPFGQDNIVEFETQWEVYASTQVIAPINTVNMEIGIQADAEIGYVYTFNGTTFWKGQPISMNMFGIENQRKQSNGLTVGLAQSIRIQQRETQYIPVYVNTVNFNNTTYFAPLDTIMVFTATYMENGLILLPSYLVPIDQGAEARELKTPGLTISRYLKVQLTKEETVIHYNGDTGVFCMGPL